MTVIDLAETGEARGKAKPRTIGLSDDVYEWVAAAAKARGMTNGAYIESLLLHARAQEARDVVQEHASAALEDAIHAGIGAGFEQLVQHLGPLFDLLTLEATRGRMTAEELLAYLYDGDNLQCPHCHKPYVQGRPGASYAAQRSAAIKQMAQTALAAGTVPRIRPW